MRKQHKRKQHKRKQHQHTDDKKKEYKEWRKQTNPFREQLIRDDLHQKVLAFYELLGTLVRNKQFSANANKMFAAKLSENPLIFLC